MGHGTSLWADGFACLGNKGEAWDKARNRENTYWMNAKGDYVSYFYDTIARFAETGVEGAATAWKAGFVFKALGVKFSVYFL